MKDPACDGTGAQVAYGARAALREGGVAAALPAPEREAAEAAVDEALAWLEGDEGGDAALGAIEERRRALEAAVHPLMAKVM